MSRLQSELEQVRKVDRAKWVDLVRVMIIECEGNLTAVGRAFGLGRRQIRRVIYRAELVDVLEDARTKRRKGKPKGWRSRRLPIVEPSGNLDNDDSWLARTRKALQ